MSEKAGGLSPDSSHGLRYVQYDSSKESIYLSAIRQLISNDLSEPYSIYVYRYFLYQWGDLCFMVRCMLCRTQRSDTKTTLNRLSMRTITLLA